MGNRSPVHINRHQPEPYPQRLQTKVSTDLDKRFRAAAHAAGMGVGQFIREALAHFCTHIEAAQAMREMDACE